MAKKVLKKSPFAPQSVIVPFNVDGAVCATVQCGLYKHKEDLALFYFPQGASVAGVFTRSQMASPPVLKCRENLKEGRASALIVNSGNSLAMTGEAGKKIVNDILACVSNSLSISVNEVFICSTGIIGALMDHSKIMNAVPALKASLGNNFGKTSEAIMTTDTFPKVYSSKVNVGGKEVTITGIAKGSGMIEPNMATMLSYVFTDVKIPSDTLQELVNEHVETSFNAITVDSDTSTSDSLIVFATNKVDANIELTENLEVFSNALKDAMQNLAKQIVMDGEGAQKFITVNVTGAKSDDSAKIIAKAIANSPLVKTAIAGSDPNWGRIAMAIGKTSEDIDLTKLAIAIGKHRIYENEGLYEKYMEDEVYYYLRGAFVEINVNVGNVGSGSSVVWTCDLTHGYIDINVDYRS